jgi:hypothetical protein
MSNDKSPPEPKTSPQEKTGGDCVSRLVVPLDSPWIVVDGSYDTLEVHTAKGEYVCAVHGDTLGVQCDRASLIAHAPRLLERCRNLESALHRLLTADIPRPLGGIIDDDERQAAIEWNAFERGEARQHARPVLRHNAVGLARRVSDFE